MLPSYVNKTYGFPCSRQWLAKLAVIGGGPVFRKAGRFPLYKPSDLDAWAQSRIGPATGVNVRRRKRISERHCQAGGAIVMCFVLFSIDAITQHVMSPATAYSLVIFAKAGPPSGAVAEQLSVLSLSKLPHEWQ